MLKEEIDRLRARYHGFEHMMHQAWFKWDSATNKVSIDATKDVWEDFTEVNSWKISFYAEIALAYSNMIWNGNFILS